jgi:hypothetical protein
MYSLVHTKVRTTKQPQTAKIYDIDSESEAEDGDGGYDVKPELVPKEDKNNENNEKDEKKETDDKKDPPASTFIDCYEIPRSACGPSEAQYRLILGKMLEAKICREFCEQLFARLRDTYYATSNSFVRRASQRKQLAMPVMHTGSNGTLHF